MTRVFLAVMLALCACEKKAPAPVAAPRPAAAAFPARPTQPKGAVPPPGVRPESYAELGEVSAGDAVYIKGLLMETMPFDPNGCTVGLLSIKCPGPDEPLGAEALAFTREFLKGKQAWVVTPWSSKTDPAHGYAYIYRCPDGEFLNGELVRAGLARVTDVGDAGVIWKLKGLEEEARAKRVGIWK